MTTIRTEAGVPGTGVRPEWLQVIHTANDIATEAGQPPVFGKPTSQGRWWAGGFAEEYPDARMILPDPEHGRAHEEGALLVSKTDRGDRVLRQAAEGLGIPYQPTRSNDMGPAMEHRLSWEGQAEQYPPAGEPGIGYFAGDAGFAQPVDCLLWRDETGALRGILNHYPVDMPPWEQAGNLTVLVQPGWRRRASPPRCWTRRCGAGR